MFTYGAGDGTQVRAEASRKWEALGVQQLLFQSTEVAVGLVTV